MASQSEKLVDMKRDKGIIFSTLLESAFLWLSVSYDDV
jgi:hypothetical protein